MALGGVRRSRSPRVGCAGGKMTQPLDQLVYLDYLDHAADRTIPAAGLSQPDCGVGVVGVEVAYPPRHHRIRAPPADLAHGAGDERPFCRGGAVANVLPVARKQPGRDCGEVIGRW